MTLVAKGRDGLIVREADKRLGGHVDHHLRVRLREGGGHRGASFTSARVSPVNVPPTPALRNSEGSPGGRA
jgi:hypothetical protein